MYLKRIWLAVLSSNYWFYDFNATSFHKFYWNFWKYFFVTLVIFPSLSQYSDIDNSQWLREEFQLVIDKFCREKFMIRMASTFSYTLLLNFLGSAGFFCCFHNHKTYGDVFLMT